MSAPIAQIETLSALTRKEAVSVLASAEALISHVPPPVHFAAGVVTIESGSEISFEKLLQRLDDLAFEGKDFVEGYGDFAVRRGILDVFPFAGEHPLRIEFWGDRVESIREFDPLSQRSIAELQKASLVAKLTPDAGGSRACVFDYLQQTEEWRQKRNFPGLRPPRRCATLPLEKRESFRKGVRFANPPPNQFDGGTRPAKWVCLVFRLYRSQKTEDRSQKREKKPQIHTDC